MQGGYLRKGFSKHGPLSNPYAFGYFNAMPHNKVPRFTHNFIVYEGAVCPNDFGEDTRGGADPGRGGDERPHRDRLVVQDAGHRPPDQVQRDGWFRPVDIKAGPDGAVYVCDWYDAQVNHYRNHEGKIDPQNGRVYRLRAKGAVLEIVRLGQADYAGGD